MTTFTSVGDGALFPNDQGGVTTRPNMRGKVTINGEEFVLSAWTRTIKRGNQSGMKMLSIQVQKADEETPESDVPVPDVAEVSGAQETPADDDLPF